LVAINTDNVKISPFNIKDAISVPFFDKDEALDLFEQFQAEYRLEIDDEVKLEVLQYTAGHPGLFCLCGRIIQDLVVGRKLKKFSLNDWKQIVSQGILLDRMTSYPTTTRILADFSKTTMSVIEQARLGFIHMIYNDLDTTFKMDPSSPLTTFLADEGLIVVNDLDAKTFRITSSLMRDTFGLLLQKRTKLPVERVYQNTFDIFSVLQSALKCFDCGNLLESYKFATKTIESQKDICGNVGLKEAVYQFELGSILRAWLPFDINIIVQANIKDNDESKKYPDIILSCEKFKIVLELAANERVSHKAHGNELPASIYGHIDRTKQYAKSFNAEPWLIHFVGLNSIEDSEKVAFPQTNLVNIMLVVHDHKFTSMCVKTQKITDTIPSTVKIF